MEMTIAEWIDFLMAVVNTAVILVPLCLIIVLAEMIRLIVWLIKSGKEIRDGKDK